MINSFILPESATQTLEALKLRSELAFEVIFTPLGERLNILGKLGAINQQILKNRQWAECIQALAHSEDAEITALNAEWLKGKLAERITTLKNHASDSVPRGFVLKPHDYVRIEAMQLNSSYSQCEFSSLTIDLPDEIHTLSEFCLLNYESESGFNQVSDSEGVEFVFCTVSASDFIVFVKNSPVMWGNKKMQQFIVSAEKIGDQLACFDINFPMNGH